MTSRPDHKRGECKGEGQHGGRPRSIDADYWRGKLDELAAKHGVPGASLGILRLEDEQLLLASTGVLSLATGVEVTDDSVFQIGSITKVWTATVVMQLVDDGLLDLDAPIMKVLPELELADPDVAKRVTMRHLLAHTSGIDGDVFTDTGRGDDCIETYVELLGDVAQNHPLGATFSYCNSGFVIAGRVIEKLTGTTWDTAMRERLYKPLGLKHTVTLPEEAILFRAACGHVFCESQDVEPARSWMLPRSVGPAGLVTASAADVLAFARMHLSCGFGPRNERVLTATSASSMTEKQVELPDKDIQGDSWGLGWIRYTWDGSLVIGHDGNTIGQSAFLRMLPEQGLAVTLLTNGGHARDLYQELFREIFAELAGIAMATPIEPADKPPTIGAREHLGTYERESLRIEIFECRTNLRIRQTVTGAFADLTDKSVTEYNLIPISDNQFVYRAPGVRFWTPVVFYSLATGERYIHTGVRAAPKVA